MVVELQLTQKERLSYLSRTRFGIVFFLVSFSLSFLGVLLSLVPCISGLIGLVAFGALIAGFVLMILGSKAFSTTHRFLIIVSMVGLVVLFIVTVFIGVVGAFAIGIGSFMPGSKITGADVIDFLKATRTLTVISLIPAMLMMAMYSLVFFGVSRKWGKAVLIAFVASIPVFGGISFFLKDRAISDMIDSIDPEEDYTTQEFTDVSTELGKKMFLASLINELPLLMLITSVVGSLLYVGKLRSETLNEMPKDEHVPESAPVGGEFHAPEGAIPEEPPHEFN